VKACAGAAGTNVAGTGAAATVTGVPALLLQTGQAPIPWGAQHVVGDGYLLFAWCVLGHSDATVGSPRRQGKLQAAIKSVARVDDPISARFAGRHRVVIGTDVGDQRKIGWPLTVGLVPFGRLVRISFRTARSDSSKSLVSCDS